LSSTTSNWNKQEEKQMLKLMLNLHKPNNYAFFCPVSKVHLTVSSPVGFANEVTPAILKAVKANTVLDVDGVIDLETGSAAKSKPEATKSPEKAEVSAPKEDVVAPTAEPVESKGAEVPVDEEPAEDTKTASKKGKKATKGAE
jgi:hypothetical protein